MTEYLVTSRFWFESLQNWQSEFLAVLSIVLLSIVLRQRVSAVEARPRTALRDRPLRPNSSVAS